MRSRRVPPVNPLLVHGGIVAPLLLFFASAGLRAPARARRAWRGARSVTRDEVVGARAARDARRCSKDAM